MMLVVDAHVHAWRLGEATPPHRRSPITREILVDEMRRAGVARAVLVTASWDSSGNAYCLALAQLDPDRFAVMGMLEPHVAHSRDQLHIWMRQTGLKGIRLLFDTKEQVALLRDGHYARLWRAAEELDLVIALLIPGALELVDRIAQRHPALTLIIDHLGLARGASGPAAFDHLPSLLALATHPNVYIKASGIGEYALDPYPFKSLQAALRRVFDAFGPKRILWGSNLSRLHHPYLQCVTHFGESLSWLSSRDLELIMGGNICRLLDWKWQRH